MSKRNSKSGDAAAAGAADKSIAGTGADGQKRSLGSIIFGFIKTVPLEIIAVLFRPKDPQAAETLNRIIALGRELQTSLQNTSFIGVPTILRNALASLIPLVGQIASKDRSQKDAIELAMTLTRIISIIPSALSGPLQRRAYALMLQDHATIVQLVKQEVSNVGAAEGWSNEVKNRTTDLVLAAVFMVAVAVPTADNDPTDESIAESAEALAQFKEFAAVNGLEHEW